MRIPLFLPAFLSALFPHVSIQQRPISDEDHGALTLVGEVRRGLLEGGEDVALDACCEVVCGLGDEADP